MGQQSRHFIVAVFLSIMIAGAGEAAGQGHLSARVEALGGEAVTGIVRDTLTDIYLHPAFLASCDRLTINYGQRLTPELYFGFPILDKNAPLFRWPNEDYIYHTFIESGRSNEVTLYGIGLGEWRFAASAEWRYYHTEQSNPYGFSYYEYMPDIRQATGYETYKMGERYIRADFSAARRLSGDYFLGIRIGGITSKHERIPTTVETTFQYEVNTEPYSLVPDYRRYNYSMLDEIECFSGAFAQLGLLKGSGSELNGIDLRISRNEIYYRMSSQNVTSSTYYDPVGDPDEYGRSEATWRDERYGTVWSYDLMGRFSSASGLRIFAGIGFEHMKYGADWNDLIYTYGWNEYYNSEWDGRATMEFDGDGAYSGFKAFVKAGKSKSLRDDLEITAGLSARMSRRWSEEEPVADFTYYSLTDGSLLTISLDEPLEISTDRIDARLDIPVAIDFEPAHWISVWSGFRVYAKYKRLDDTIPEIDARNLENITSYLDLEDYTPVYDAFRLDDTDVSSTATVGVSLHYKNRFFVDLYTGSDLTPDNLTSYILDVRYVF